MYGQMTSKNKRPSEFELIAKYFAPLTGEGSFGLVDDAAELIPPPGHSLVITQDAIAEGIHFSANDPPGKIAQKAIRVNLSDLAAKGAVPHAVSIALGLGKNWTEDWIADFSAGLAADRREFNITLIGGDTFGTGTSTVISVSAIGYVPEGKYTSRLGAKAKDLVYVTGTIGDGALGLAAMKNELPGLSEADRAFLVSRYLLPQPRVEALDVIQRFATASMDISDGLVADAEKLALASSLSINIESAFVPLSDAASRVSKDESNSLKTALSGGDDYEILFTIAPDDRRSVEEAAAGLPFAVTPVGQMEAGQGVRVFDRDGRILEFQSKGYDHSGTNL